MNLSNGFGRGDGWPWLTCKEANGGTCAFDVDFEGVTCRACRMARDPGGRWRFRPCAEHQRAWKAV